jgi:hypothetical protein
LSENPGIVRRVFIDSERHLPVSLAGVVRCPRPALTGIRKLTRKRSTRMPSLQRLIELLGGSDLSLIEEIVTRAARSGLDVSCRFEGTATARPLRRLTSPSASYRRA